MAWSDAARRAAIEARRRRAKGRPNRSTLHNQRALAVDRLHSQIKRSSVYEDRLEYTPSDLSSAYGIDSAQARLLHKKLHAGDPYRVPARSKESWQAETKQRARDRYAGALKKARKHLWSGNPNRQRDTRHMAKTFMRQESGNFSRNTTEADRQRIRGYVASERRARRLPPKSQRG